MMNQYEHYKTTMSIIDAIKELDATRQAVGRLTSLGACDRAGASGQIRIAQDHLFVAHNLLVESLKDYLVKQE